MMPGEAHHVPVLGIHHDGDPEPGVGAVLEVGTIPAPEHSRSGDCLTFTRLPEGWVQQRNRSPRQEPVGYDTVQFWSGGTGARILTVAGDESPRTGRPALARTSVPHRSLEDILAAGRSNRVSA